MHNRLMVESREKQYNFLDTIKLMCLVTTTHNNDNDSNNRGIHFVVCTMIS